MTSTNATPAGSTSNGDDGTTHPAEQTGSIGAILAAILSLTCFVACLGVFAFSPERRNSVRRLFVRSTSAVRYSRVQSNEEANLLLEPNGEFTESDDDMLL
ncbi:uncharacterized protein LOC129235867 [Anastrepha obliqua]|uniref:uncharacterized protein LOC129235867 n=1 Tax=Anastrepha obliqua TaxID=95512 RepID=UPI0024092C33|nr:uncharacterized protein LOC129235867 [Anastrepha obliqua]